ncbi:MAG: radical SAM family heme chaperone HemW [Flavobacteriia bacterium]|nr:radical SAM family heme chaperone HemW [Flavobacteriia bacterium]
MGIYFHIPFCKKKCTYCDFHFSTNYRPYYHEMITSMTQELEMKKDRINSNIESVYFGGGTPGLLKSEDIKGFIDLCRKNFPLIEAEITLEVNPENVTKKNLKDWKEAGINRLSIGVQSFDNEVLKWMNRSHNSKQSMDAIYFASEEGFEQINIDIIFALPQKDSFYWKKQLKHIESLPISHLSAYQLTFEKKTLLFHQYKEKLVYPLEDEETRNQFLFTHEFLENIGFEQYEISNYAKNNSYSKHNSSYWMGKEYLGIGPSAHSFHFPYRFWNIKNNRTYINSIKNRSIPEEAEKLSVSETFNENIMLGLRTKWGVDINELKKIKPLSFSFLETIDCYQKQKLLKIENEKIILTLEGWLLTDKISSDLFCD